MNRLICSLKQRICYKKYGRYNLVFVNNRIRYYRVIEYLINFQVSSLVRVCKGISCCLKGKI
jgi:hypothetical protein